MKRFSALFIISLLHTVPLLAQVNNLPSSGASVVNSANIARPSEYSAGPNPQPVKFNFTRVATPFLPGTTLNMGPDSSIAMTTTYYNGHGQPLQSITMGAKDIVTTYDQRSTLYQVSYLPFVTNNYKARFRLFPYSEQKLWYDTNYPGEGDNAYNRTKNVVSGSNHFVETYGPGKSLSGGNRGITTSVETNSTIIKRFGLIDYLSEVYPNILGDFPVGTLTVKKVTGQHNQLTYEYYNKSKQLLCKQVESGTTGNNKLLSTYYVYDDLGRITWVITPKAIETLENGGWPAFSSVLPIMYRNLCYGYQYNKFGSVITKRVPGKGIMSSVYDSRQRPVLVQDAIQAGKGEWTFQVYDTRGRAAISGIYYSSSSRETLQAAVDAPGTPASGTLAFYMANNFSGDYPATMTDCRIDVYNYYDSYSFGSTFPYSRSFSTAYTGKYNLTAEAVEPVPFNYVNGLLTASKVRVIDPNGLNEWIPSVFFYDQKARAIQVHQLNPFSTTDWDVATTQFNFNGSVAVVINDHHLPGTDKQNTVVVTRNYYDWKANGRITKTNQRVDTRQIVVLAEYIYDDLGRVKIKSIGNGIEQQKFDYNIRGQVTGINADYVYSNTYPHATFGCILSYDEGFQKPRYDGAIAGMIWRGAGSQSPARAYGYEYDNAGRMTGADFNERNPFVPFSDPWNKTSHDYSVPQVTYDANGNILSLKQRGTTATYGPMDMDDLTYYYETNSNRLSRVEDSRPDNNMNDFVNRNAGSQDYTYDLNGNLKSDKNKEILNIDYNDLDLPLAVSTVNKGSISNTYDANGTLLRKTITPASGPAYSYRYCGPFVYKDNHLEYILNSEGRARFLDNTQDYKYDYFIKDHLGNVRTIVNYQGGSILEYKASHELSSAGAEALVFNGTERRLFKPAPSPDDEYGVDLLGSDPNKRVGTSLLLKVMAGDKFKARVSAYYYGENFNPDHPAVERDEMASSLLSVLSGGLSPLGNENGGSELLNSLIGPENFAFPYDEIVNTMTDPTAPRAYLNYVLFDEEFHVNAEKSGVLQVTSANLGNWSDLEMGSELTVEGNGYLLVYLSSRDLDEVIYMDNLEVAYTKGNLLEEQHYYPNGLVVQDGSNNPLVNRYLYQGKELQKEAGLELYDFHARQYDPQIGRFWGIDPMDQFPSGYTGMGNDPGNMIDPSGMQANGVGPLGGASVGVRYGDVLQDRTQWWTDGTWSQRGGLPAEVLDAYLKSLKAQENKNNEKVYAQGKTKRTNQQDLKAGSPPPIDYNSDELRPYKLAANWGMKLSKQGIDFIKGWEGFKDHLYDAKDGLGKVTIGYGTTIEDPEELSYYKTHKMDEATASDRFAQELTYYEQQVIRNIKVELTQPQFDALVSLSYNMGRLSGSPLLIRAINSGNDSQILPNWITNNNAGSTNESGLTTRRYDEMRIWYQGNYNVNKGKNIFKL